MCDDVPNKINGSIFKFLEPVNYISSSQWRLSKDKPINIGWEVEDHNNTIHSITSSSNNEYIISCSNDKLAKFHRVLMYPNLYPDWTHIYYGSLKLRGFENDDIENLKCLQTLDGKQLITLSINKKDNRIHLDTFSMIELDNIENRKPIFEMSSATKPNINQLSNITNFNIIFPLDDYNQVWVNSSALKSTSLKPYISKKSIKQIESNLHFSPYTYTSTTTAASKLQQHSKSNNKLPILDLSLNGKYLLLSYDNKIKIQTIHDQNHDNGNQKFKWEIINIENNYQIQDIIFLPNSKQQQQQQDTSFLVLLIDIEKQQKQQQHQHHKEHDHQDSSTKLLLYKNNGGEGENNNKWNNPIELEFPQILLSNSVKMIRNKVKDESSYDCVNNSGSMGESPIFVTFQDERFTIHIGQIMNDKLYLIKSLPLPFHQEIPDDLNHQVSIDFSKDSTILSIQYPNSNTIYIYSRDDIEEIGDDGLFDFRLTSVIDDLPQRSHGAVLLFNFKYHYLVTNFNGHLSFFRDFKTKVSQCDPSSRTKSFYLPSPPLKSNYSTSKLELEQFGLLYLLKPSHVGVGVGDGSSGTSLVKFKIIMYTILAYFLVSFLQKLLIPLEIKFIGPTIEKLLKKSSGGRINLDKAQNIIFYIAALAILGLSIFEIIQQPAYTNDWPAHIHHIEQFLNPPPPSTKTNSSNGSIFKPLLLQASTTTTTTTTTNTVRSNNEDNKILFPSVHNYDDENASSSSSSEEEFLNEFNIKQHNITAIENQFFSNYLPNFIKNNFDFDYSHYMHYHGPNTYPAGFIYLYTALYYITNFGQSLQIFQLIWAFLEFINFILIKKICQKLSIPIILSILPILSNRLHLYNVRVLINDFPSTFLIHLSILLLLSKRFKLFSILYSLTVSLKLHTIFHSPAILFIFFNNLSYYDIILNLGIMAIIQVLIGLPFLMVNPIAYFTNAYDFSRTLLWEKTRNFKFIGRIIYDSNLFNLFLLFSLIITILIFIYKFQSIINEIKRLLIIDSNNGIGDGNGGSELKFKRIYILSFLSINFFAVVWARGLYTPFMCWYFYTLPIILYFAQFSYTFIILYWVSHELLFRFFNDFYTEMFATYLFFNINFSILIRLYNNFNINSITSSSISSNAKKTQ